MLVDARLVFFTILSVTCAFSLFVSSKDVTVGALAMHVVLAASVTQSCVYCCMAVDSCPVDDPARAVMQILGLVSSA